MRVLAVMASLMGGGAERQMVLLLRGLDRERFAPALCLLSRHGEFLDEVPDDVPVAGLGKRSAADAPVLVARLARHLAAVRPDVVFAKVDYTNTIAALARRASGRRMPLVLGEESVQSHALRDMSVPAFRRELLRGAYRAATRVVAPSAGVADDLVAHLRLAPGSVSVIPNMVDVAAVRSAAERPATHPFLGSPLPLVVSAGRLVRAKGQRDLVEAIAVVNRSRACNLLLLGEGPDRPVLEARTRELGIAERVALPGFVDNPFSVLAGADVFVSPSHFESFGNVIIEAMASGAPVVSTRVPAGPEHLIADGRTGVFAPPRDPDALAERILGVLANPRQREALAAAGRELAATYDTTAVVARYEGLLTALADRTRTL